MNSSKTTGGLFEKKKKPSSAFPSSLKLYRYISSFPLTWLSRPSTITSEEEQKDKRISGRISAVSSFSVRLPLLQLSLRQIRDAVVSPSLRTWTMFSLRESFFPGEITSGEESGGSRASRYVASTRAWRRRQACLRNSPPANSQARSTPVPTSAARSNATDRPRPRWSRAGTGTAG